MNNSPNRSDELESGLSPQQLIDWIESVDNTDEAYQQNIRKFNDAVYDLIQHGSRASDLLLAKLDSSSHHWMIWGAIWTLKEIGEVRSIDLLWKVYEKEVDRIGIQIYALIALSYFKDERILEPAIKLIKESRASIAIMILGNLGDERGVYYLSKLLNDIEANVDKATKFYETPALFDKFEAMLPAIKLNLRDKRSIIEALSKIGGTKSVRLLNKIIAEKRICIQLISHYERLKVDAIYALSRINHPDVINTIKDAQRHRQYGVRNAARKLSKSLTCKI